MQINTDWVGLIDEWAGRFFQELDYEREARNAVVFRDQMADLGGITVAEVYENLTSREILTTAWVQGKLLFCLWVFNSEEKVHGGCFCSCHLCTEGKHRSTRQTLMGDAALGSQQR